MSKKNSRRQVRKQADTAGAREAEFEAKYAAERAKAIKATSVVNDAEALALSILADAGWQIESLEGGHGMPYQFLVSAERTCEQVVEAKTAIKLVKAVRELGEPDLYPAVVEYEAETEEEYFAKLDVSIAQADAGEVRPLSEIYTPDEAELEEMLAVEAALPVLVNAVDAEAVRAAGHMSTKVIELPALQPIVAGLSGQVRSTIEMSHSIYVSGRGDIVVLDQGENPFAGEGVLIEGGFIQVRDLAESIGMVFRGNGGYNGSSGYFEYPEVAEKPANLFPHPATSLFRAGTRVERDPLSGAFVAPKGKVFELVNQVMGLSHRQKTIHSAAWEKKGWVAQVVTL